MTGAEVVDEGGAVGDVTDGEIADEDDVGRWRGDGVGGGEAVLVKEGEVWEGVGGLCSGAGAGERSFIEIDGDGVPGFVAAEAFFDPAKGDGGGAGKIFAEDAGLIGVGGDEEVDDMPRRLDAEFVEIEMGEGESQLRVPFRECRRGA
ncbi:MAG: hypothetical protein KGS45_02480 [Planctomycetes bacterium]|nr:hypothetical protein [Planctomycetota bacterium]